MICSCQRSEPLISVVSPHGTPVAGRAVKEQLGGRRHELTHIGPCLA